MKLTEPTLSNKAAGGETKRIKGTKCPPELLVEHFTSAGFHGNKPHVDIALALVRLPLLGAGAAAAAPCCAPMLPPCWLLHQAHQAAGQALAAAQRLGLRGQGGRRIAPGVGVPQSRQLTRLLAGTQTTGTPMLAI